MINNILDKKSDYKNIEDVLKPLGFEQETPGRFHHNLINYSFDFSACSEEGTMKVLFNLAYDLGYEKAQADMQKAIGIPVNTNIKLKHG